MALIFAGSRLRLTPFVAALLAASLLKAGIALAEEPGPQAPEVKAYTLDIDKIRHYAAAIRTIEDTARGDKGVEAELERMSQEPDGTLDQLRAKLKRHPRILAFYTSVELSAEDAVLLPLATANAMLATDPNADPAEKDIASPEQIRFAEAHRPELVQLMDWGDGQD